MAVPDEIALQLRHAHVIAIVSGDDARMPMVRETGELLRQVDCFWCGGTVSHRTFPCREEALLLFAPQPTSPNLRLSHTRQPDSTGQPAPHSAWVRRKSQSRHL